MTALRVVVSEADIILTMAYVQSKTIAYAIDPHSILGIYPLAFVALLRNVPRVTWIFGIAEASMKLASTLQLHSYSQVTARAPVSCSSCSSFPPLLLLLFLPSQGSSASVGELLVR